LSDLIIPAMRIAIRIVSALVVLTFGYTWTVGQGGFDTVNHNLCELWNNTFWTLSSCRFNIYILWVWGVGAALAGLFLIIEAAKYFLARRARDSARNPQREISVMEALWWIVESSAYGRWLDATRGKDRERRRLLLAASELQRRHIENGDIVVRGRFEGTIPYYEIDRRFWEHVVLDVEPDLNAVFRVTIVRREASRVRIPAYDRLVIDREQLEARFPAFDWKISREIAAIFIKTKLRSAIALLQIAINKVDATYIIIFGLLVALGGATFTLWRKNQPSQLSQAEIEKFTAPLKSQLTAAIGERDGAIKQRDELQSRLNEAQHKLESVVQSAPSPSPNGSTAGFDGKVVSLTSGQKSALIEELIKLQPNLSSVQITRSSAAPYSQDLSALAGLFDRAGIVSNTGVQRPKPRQTGLQIGVDDLEHPPEMAQQIKATFERYGIAMSYYKLEPKDARGEKGFNIFIGPEPL
jgi:hypothetical protein